MEEKSSPDLWVWGYIQPKVYYKYRKVFNHSKPALLLLASSGYLIRWGYIVLPFHTILHHEYRSTPNPSVILPNQQTIQVFGDTNWEKWNQRLGRAKQDREMEERDWKLDRRNSRWEDIVGGGESLAIAFVHFCSIPFLTYSHWLITMPSFSHFSLVPHVSISNYKIGPYEAIFL